MSDDIPKMDVEDWGHRPSPESLGRVEPWGSEPKEGELKPCAVLVKVDQLLSEIMDSHKDPQSSDYNACENPLDRCMWCVGAAEIIDHIRAATK